MNRREFLYATTLPPLLGARTGMSLSTQFQGQRWRKLKLIFPYGDEGGWDRRPSAPHVVQSGDQLRMYYMSIEGQRRRIGLAEADISDPLSWRKASNQPLLDFGAPGSIDSHWVSYPWVVPVTEKHWHLYYCGWGGDYHPFGKFKVYRTTLAESDDAGLTWKRSGRALLELGRPFSCDEHGTGSCAVMKVGSQYWMWYTAVVRWPETHSKISIALAVSNDGGHTFRPHPAGALISIPPRLDSYFSTCSKPFVERTRSGFRMWFSVVEDQRRLYRVHYAESPDGIRWKWWPDPVLDVSESGWDSEMTCYPSIWHSPEHTYMFYDGNRFAGIGVAELVG